MQRLLGLTQLEDLNLTMTGVTDAGLKRIRGLSRLRMLDLGQTRVTGVGLVNLKGLNQFISLGLESTSIGDDAIPNLAALTGLQELDLDDTHISDAGMKNLRKALPKCDISPDVAVPTNGTTSLCEPAGLAFFTSPPSFRRGRRFFFEPGRATYPIRAIILAAKTSSSAPHFLCYNLAIGKPVIPAQVPGLTGKVRGRYGQHGTLIIARRPSQAPLVSIQPADAACNSVDGLVRHGLARPEGATGPGDKKRRSMRS